MARFTAMSSADEMNKLYPILTDTGSDSATLDNALQFLSVNGRKIEHAMLMLVPEAWQNNPLMDPDLKAFYEYHACLMEPWDGPANIAFTNGEKIGAVLDRNGLRPSRYFVTKDDPRHHGQRSRHAADRTGQHRPQVAAAAGQDFPDRFQEEAHRR